MDQPNQLQPSLISFPSQSCSQPISPSLTTWILPMSWSTTITSKWWFLIDTTPSLKSLPYSTPSPILHSPYLSRIRIMDVSRSCIHKHHPFHQCHGYSRDSRFGRAYDHSIRFILSIECDSYHSHSINDPRLLVTPISRCPRPITTTTICSPPWSLTTPGWLSPPHRGGYLHSHDIMIRLIDVCVGQYGR